MTWDKAYTIYATMDFGKWTMDRNVKLDEKVNAQKVREKVISTLKSSAEKVLIMDSNEAYQDIINMYDILKKLEGLILDFSQIFAKRKKEKNMVDFSDVEHFALKILLDEKWDEKHDKLAYYIEHDELEKVDTAIVQVKSFVENEEIPSAIAELETGKFVLEHIERKYKFNLQNIF